MSLFTTVKRVVGTSATVAALTVVPYGSVGALQSHILDGSFAKAVSEGSFLRSKYDSTNHVLYELAQLKNAPPSGLQVYLLGGSRVRECLESQTVFTQAVAAALGRPVTCHIEASNQQCVAGDLALVDNIPPGSGVVVIGVSPNTFNKGPITAKEQLNGESFMLLSPSLQDFMGNWTGQHLGNDIRWGVQSYLNTYLRRRGVPAWQGAAIGYHPHMYAPTPLSDAAKRLAVTKWLTGPGAPGGDFYSHFTFATAVLRRTIREAQAKGFAVILMENTIDTAIVGHAFDQFDQKCLAAYANVVTALGVTYVDLNQTAGLFDSDFHDLFHLDPAGRQKWLPQLSQAVAAIINDRFPVSPTATPTPSGAPSSSPAPSVGSTTGVAPAAGP